MISSIDLQTLRNGEFLQFSNDFLGIVQLNDPAALKVKPQYDAMEAIKVAIEALFKSDQGSLITDELVAIDLRRDTAITGITAFVKSLTYHFNLVTRNHALALEANIDNYGSGIAKENYQSETAIITSILTDWSTKPTLTDAVTALNITDWQAELAAANTAFNQQYLARTQELGAVSPDNIKLKRLEAMEAYYKLRDFINSYFTLNDGAQPYLKTVNELNALIAQYNTLLAGRKSSTPPAVTPAT